MAKIVNCSLFSMHRKRKSTFSFGTTLDPLLQFTDLANMKQFVFAYMDKTDGYSTTLALRTGSFTGSGGASP